MADFGRLIATIEQAEHLLKFVIRNECPGGAHPVKVLIEFVCIPVPSRGEHRLGLGRELLPVIWVEIGQVTSGRVQHIAVFWFQILVQISACELSQKRKLL